MAEKNINVRIQNKSDTSTNWAKATTFIPKKGEVVFYTDLNKIKIGDGSTVVGTLPFIDARNASSADSATNATNLKDSAGSYTYSTLKSALDGKQAAGSYAAASHTHTKSQITDFPSSLKNPYTLKLKDISGTVVNYDGSSAKDLTEGVYYSAYTGSVAYKDIRSPSYDAYDYHGMIGALDAMWDPGFSGNRLAFLDPDTFTIEYSQDSGATWTDSGYDDYNKRCVFADLFGNTPIRIGVGTNGTMPTSMSAAKALQTRLTITNPTHRYCQINRMSLWFSGAHTCYVQVQYALWETPDTFAV